MKKITFANSKGGVGKTTLTINVAQLLSQVGKKFYYLTLIRNRIWQILC